MRRVPGARAAARRGARREQLLDSGHEPAQLGFQPRLLTLCMFFVGGAFLLACDAFAGRATTSAGSRCALVAALALDARRLAALPPDARRRRSVLRALGFSWIWLLPTVLWLSERDGNGDGLQPFLLGAVAVVFAVRLAGAPAGGGSRAGGAGVTPRGGRARPDRQPRGAASARLLHLSSGGRLRGIPCAIVLIAAVRQKRFGTTQWRRTSGCSTTRPKRSSEGRGPYPSLDDPSRGRWPKLRLSAVDGAPSGAAHRSSGGGSRATRHGSARGSNARVTLRVLEVRDWRCYGVVLLLAARSLRDPDGQRDDSARARSRGRMALP